MLASTLLELKRKLRLSHLLSWKIPLASKMPLCGNKALLSQCLFEAFSFLLVDLIDPALNLELKQITSLSKNYCKSENEV